MIALAAVVLPIPISPVPTSPRAVPSTSAAPAGDRPDAPRRGVIAGPRVMLRVPGADRHVGRPRRDRPSGAATPRSATTTRAPDLAREHVDRGAAAQEVLDHLRGHRLRIGAHALGRDPVVGGEREDHRVSIRGGLSGDHDQPHRELLEPPEAPRRLREAVEALARRDGSAARPAPRSRRRADRGRSPRAGRPRARRAASADFTTSGHPATISTHLVGGARRGLVDEPEDVAKAAAERRLGMDPPPHLVRDEDQGVPGVPDRPPRAGRPRRRGRYPRAQAFCGADLRPRGSDSPRPRRRPRPRAPSGRRRERERGLDGAPGRGPLRPVSGDPRGHLVVAGLGGGDEDDAPAEGRARERRRARSCPRGRPPERGRSGGSRTTRAWSPARRDRVRQPGPPSKTGSECSGSRQVSWLSDRPTPRALPGAARQWVCLRVSSPITVTGSRRSRTAFPLGPRRGAPGTP